MVVGTPSVDLVVNCYERTYREVLRPGYFPARHRENVVTFAGTWALVNNVDDREDAAKRARALVDAGEIDGFAFVQDRLDEALRVTGLTRRSLGQRPYFLDYGLVMGITGISPYLLGWDAEVTLDEPGDWITPGVALLESRPDVFSVAPRWPARAFDTLDEETIRVESPWRMTWSFSDQVWLARRADLAAPIYRKLAPATLARTPMHTFSFEARIESHQRLARRYRAVHEHIRFTHNDLAPVLTRLGGATRTERGRAQLSRVTRKALRTLGSQRPSLRLP